jgi:ribonucleoside-diphosphate reductase alpha chain
MQSQTITHIQKRNGQMVHFDDNKITTAVAKAFIGTDAYATRSEAFTEAKRLTPIAIDIFTQSIGGDIPTVEFMQDVVEKVLMAAGHYETAKHYILYRAANQKARDAKTIIGVEDDLNLSVNQLKVMESRYLRHNEDGDCLETPSEMFTRVAKSVAANEEKDQIKWQQKFTQIMTNFEFMPAGCYLRGAGTRRQMLANCFVLPVEDSMEGIFDSVKYMAMIHQKGGGTGFNFSNLRPKGDYVVSSGGFSSGPISFMKVFDAATRQVMQGGFRRGANMGILNIEHPDILDFITSKTEDHEINNFNISVGMSDEFMQAVDSNNTFDLVNPRNGDVVQTVNARNLFNQIVTLAWRTGDPGMIFLDTINQNNPLINTLGPMIATNPCGEQPLHPFDVCNLGSINLAKFVKIPAEEPTSDLATALRNINWQRLEEVTQLAVRFLDNGVDVSTYPIDKIQETAQANRRIGLGVMGFADMLIMLGAAYNSQTGCEIARKVMKFINNVAHFHSENLADEKGVFKNYHGSTYETKGIKQRNVAITTIAPTGTISMICEASSGIEPLFALSYTKNVVDDNGLKYVNPYFEKALQKAIPDENKRSKILEEVARKGSCQQIDEIPQHIRDIYVTAHDINWQGHIRMQAAFQEGTDNAVSKTINFPNSATISDVENAYLLAWKLGCKGVTIYRDGSKAMQVLKSHQSQEGEYDKAGNKTQTEPIIQSKIKVTTLQERIKKNHTANGLAAAKTNGQVKPASQETSHEHQVHQVYSHLFNQKDHKQHLHKHQDHHQGDHYLEKHRSEDQPSETHLNQTTPCPECSAPVGMVEGCMTCYSCGWSKCSL